ncbi:MAG: hypothetical protein N4A43_03055 [Alphaproteobacteria bacterium]|jgi:hypothetical protein|nr:hypothetical protein [Alphaproteobacteria bacterium]
MIDKEITIAKDFLSIQNKDGEVMFVIMYNDKSSQPDSDAKIIYGDDSPHAVLIKNDDHAIILDFLAEETLKMMKNSKKALVTEIEYNENLVKYNLENKFSKDSLYKLFEFAEAQHALKACYSVKLEKIKNFDERFMKFIDKEIEEI